MDYFLRRLLMLKSKVDFPCSLLSFIIESIEWDIWNIHTHYVCTYDIIDISLILTLFKIDYILGKNKFLKPY